MTTSFRGTGLFHNQSNGNLTPVSQDIEEEHTHGNLLSHLKEADDFLNRMGLGDPDPSNHRTGFSGADEIVDWFKQDKPDDWRQRD